MAHSKFQHLKKLNITLTSKATTYFYDRMYSDTKEDGCTPVNNSECISHCLESLLDFEKETDNQLEGWIDDYKKLDARAKVFAASPTKENIFWQVAGEEIKRKHTSAVIQNLEKQLADREKDIESMSATITRLKKKLKIK